mmetsp:Transcript_19985/g.30257  ORF Transcript_19985/g.30257 Transcript_19985/m.30257 type:complete len:783 (-) Transcript_19985:176-2524(-)
MPITSHTLHETGRSNVSGDWLAQEISRAESSLNSVQEEIASDGVKDSDSGCVIGTGDDKLNEILMSNAKRSNNKAELEFSPTNEVSKLRQLGNKVDCIALSKGYLKALQVQEQVIVDKQDEFASEPSLHFLVEVEENLTKIFRVTPKPSSSSSPQFHKLYAEIQRRQNVIRTHIMVRSTLQLQKVLDDHAYPSPNASKYIISSIDSCSNSNAIHKNLNKNEIDVTSIPFLVGAMQQVSISMTISFNGNDNENALMREFVKPIVRRVRHHFILSETIPQDKVASKLPYLLLTYFGQVLAYTAPMIHKISQLQDGDDDSKVRIHEASNSNNREAYFYEQINALVQHVLVQRDYFESMSDRKNIDLSILVQEIMKHDASIQKYVGGREAFRAKGVPSLTERLVCKNNNLFQWMIVAQHDSAINALTKNKRTIVVKDGEVKKEGLEAIESTMEIFHSLFYSHRAKLSLLATESSTPYQCRFLQKIIIPTCMCYLNHQHESATALRNSMDAATIYGLSELLTQWIALIDVTTQTAQKLSVAAEEMNASNMADLKAMSGSFDNFSNAMLEECSNCFMNLLMERSTLSPFLMTLSHILSRGPDEGVCNTEVADVHMILEALKLSSTGEDNGKLEGRENRLLGRQHVKNQIISNVSAFLEQQFLEVIMDDMLTLKVDGCQVFISVVDGLMTSLRGVHIHGDGSNARLEEFCNLLNESVLKTMRDAICTLLEKDSNESINMDEVEIDGTIHEVIQSMIQSKGFEHLDIAEIISLLNRTRPRQLNDVMSRFD